MNMAQKKPKATVQTTMYDGSNFLRNKYIWLEVWFLFLRYLILKHELLYGAKFQRTVSGNSKFDYEILQNLHLDATNRTYIIKSQIQIKIWFFPVRLQEKTLLSNWSIDFRRDDLYNNFDVNIRCMVEKWGKLWESDRVV